MKPKMLFTLFIMGIIASFLPIYPNPRKQWGLNRYNPLVASRVNLWKYLSTPSQKPQPDIMKEPDDYKPLIYPAPTTGRVYARE